MGLDVAEAFSSYIHPSVGMLEFLLQLHTGSLRENNLFGTVLNSTYSRCKLGGHLKISFLGLRAPSKSLCLQLLLVSGVVCRPRLLRQHEGVQVAHLRQARLDVMHVHLHRVLELGRVLGPQPGLDLGQRVLQGLQLESISATREMSSALISHQNFRNHNIEKVNKIR